MSMLGTGVLFCAALADLRKFVDISKTIDHMPLLSLHHTPVGEDGVQTQPKQLTYLQFISDLLLLLQLIFQVGS